MELKKLQGRHRGEDFVVCGCGNSLATFKDPERYNTIGVNDVGQLFVPDYLIVLNPEESFSPDRWKNIKKTSPSVFLSPFKLNVWAKEYVQFRLGKKGFVGFSDPDVLNFSLHSPYVAVNLAILMGAKKIGLIGVDFTQDHFFGKTGNHKLLDRLDQINSHFQALEEHCLEQCIEIVNLSEKSRITAFRKGAFEEISQKPLRDPKVGKTFSLGVNGGFLKRRKPIKAGPFPL